MGNKTKKDNATYTPTNTWLKRLLILCIPGVNIVLLLKWAFEENESERKHYAIAQLIIAMIMLSVCIVLGVMFVGFGYRITKTSEQTQSDEITKESEDTSELDDTADNTVDGVEDDATTDEDEDVVYYKGDTYDSSVFSNEVTVDDFNIVINKTTAAELLDAFDADEFENVSTESGELSCALTNKNGTSIRVHVEDENVTYNNFLSYPISGVSIVFAENTVVVSNNMTLTYDGNDAISQTETIYGEPTSGYVYTQDGVTYDYRVFTNDDSQGFYVITQDDATYAFLLEF